MFVFFYSSPLSVHETKSLDVGRSKPVNMPTTTTYPILIESGSVSSCDQSPKLQDTYQRTLVEPGGAGEVQLREDLAEAMLESPGVREAGGYFIGQLLLFLFCFCSIFCAITAFYLVFVVVYAYCCLPIYGVWYICLFCLKVFSKNLVGLYIFFNKTTHFTNEFWWETRFFNVLHRCF